MIHTDGRATIAHRITKLDTLEADSRRHRLARNTSTSGIERKSHSKVIASIEAQISDLRATA